MAIGGGGWGLHDILEAYSNKQMQYVILWDYDDDTEQWLRNQTMALFTQALKPVSNHFSFKPVCQTTSIIWFTESGFQSTLGAFTQLP